MTIDTNFPLKHCVAQHKNSACLHKIHLFTFLHFSFFLCKLYMYICKLFTCSRLEQVAIASQLYLDKNYYNSKSGKVYSQILCVAT